MKTAHMKPVASRALITKLIEKVINKHKSLKSNSKFILWSHYTFRVIPHLLMLHKKPI
jgi:hypothetical protein